MRNSGLISENVYRRIEQRTPEFPESRTTSSDKLKFSEIAYWFALPKSNTFPVLVSFCAVFEMFGSKDNAPIINEHNKLSVIFIS